MKEMQDYFDDLLKESTAPLPVALKEEEVNKELLETLQKQKLQALLNQQKWDQSKTSTHTQSDTQTKVQSKVESKIETQARVDLKAQIAIKKQPETRLKTEVKAEEKTDVKPETQVSALLSWKENGRPVWAQEAFDVLLFSVSGLTLAVPLIALGQIQKIDNNITPLFGQSDWFMGLLKSPQGNIKTVNTALFVMPERYNPDFVDSARFVISIDGLKWGLAVDSVNQPSRIHPDDVNWRGNRSKRPWLAGTVKAAMCALIDIPQMGKILSDSEK